MALILSTSFALGEPSPERAIYTIPESILAASIEEFYGVWKVEYVSINGTTYTFDSYLDYSVYIENPNTYKKQNHTSFYIIDGINEATTMDDTFATKEFSSQFVNGKLTYTESDGTIVIDELLADGNLCESSTIENVEIKMIAIREPNISTFLQNKWLKINTDTGMTYDDFLSATTNSNSQSKKTDGNIYLIDDPQSITLYLTGKNEMFGSNALNVEYVIVNNMDTTLDLTFDSIVINGWEVNETLSGTYNIGSKNRKKCTITIFLDDADISFASEIKEMVLNFHIADSDKLKILNRFGPITLRFDGKNWTKVK